MPAPDPGRLRDPELRPIAQKVIQRQRLDADDARVLYRTPDLTGVGRLAAYANERLNGDRVFFSANQHINPTNVCILRNTCVFCSFARMPKEDGAYTRTLEEVFHEAESFAGLDLLGRIDRNQLREPRFQVAGLLIAADLSDEQIRDCDPL